MGKSPSSSRPKRMTSPSFPSSSRRKSSPPRSVDSSAHPASRGNISYETNGRTDRIIDWLTDNPSDCNGLFSDNMQDTSAEGRHIRTPRTSKMVYYRKIASAIFGKDQEESANYAKDPGRYAKSVENHIQGKVLGQTGAGLRVEDLEEDEDMQNLVARLSVDFPNWKRLHDFWRTIPSFDPYTQSAEHGQDLAAQAQELLIGGKGKRRREKEKDQERDEEGDEEVDVDTEVGNDDPADVVPSPPVSSIANARLFASAGSLSSRSVSRYSRSISRGRTSSRRKLRGSNLTYGAITGSSSSPTTVDDDDRTSYVVDLTSKRLELQIAKQLTKRARYEYLLVSANMEIEKEKLKQQDRLVVMQLERDREKDIRDREARARWERDIWMVQSHWQNNVMRNPRGLSIQRDPFGAGPSIQRDPFGAANAPMPMQHLGAPSSAGPSV